MKMKEIKNNRPLTPDNVAEWWNRWAEIFTLNITANFFRTSPRTVKNWLTTGLDRHDVVDGLPTCYKRRDPFKGADVWAMNPLGVICWHIGRLAEGINFAPEVIVDMMEEDNFKLCHKLRWPRRRSIPEMTWANVVEHELYFWLPAVDFYRSGYGWGGPINIIALEMPNETYIRHEMENEE